MAEQKLLKLTISRVNEAVFSGDVASVTLPGVVGEMTVLADHEPIISPLKAGTITIKRADGSNESHQIESGTLEISHNQATVLI